VLGKTNAAEMAMDYDANNPVFGRTNNPWNLSMNPGGSSGGEAAAIAAHMSPGGLGSDLAGSVTHVSRKRTLIATGIGRNPIG